MGGFTKVVKGIRALVLLSVAHPLAILAALGLFGGAWLWKRSRGAAAAARPPAAEAMPPATATVESPVAGSEAGAPATNGG